jgi:hypothetical protein
MKKNRNVSPLILQTIDRLSGCMLFTKFDVWWGYNNVCIKDGDEWKAAFLTPNVTAGTRGTLAHYLLLLVLVKQSQGPLSWANEGF